MTLTRLRSRRRFDSREMRAYNHARFGTRHHQKIGLSRSVEVVDYFMPLIRLTSYSQKTIASSLIVIVLE